MFKRVLKLLPLAAIALCFLGGVLIYKGYDSSAEIGPATDACAFGRLVEKGPLTLCVPNALYVNASQQVYGEIRSSHKDRIASVPVSSTDGHVTSVVLTSVREDGSACPATVSCFRATLWGPRRPGMLAITVTARTSSKETAVEVTHPLRVMDDRPTDRQRTFHMYPATGSMYVHGTRVIYFEYAAWDLSRASRPALNATVRNGTMEHLAYANERGNGKSCPSFMRCGFIKVRSKGKPGVMKIKLRMFDSRRASAPVAVATSIIRVIPDDFDLHVDPVTS